MNLANAIFSRLHNLKGGGNDGRSIRATRELSLSLGIINMYLIESLEFEERYLPEYSDKQSDAAPHVRYPLLREATSIEKASSILRRLVPLPRSRPSTVIFD